MGSRLWIARIRKWIQEEINLQALGERMFQKNTLYGLGVMLSAAGIWKVAPEKVRAFEGLLIFAWTTWQIVHNKNKAIDKKVEEVVGGEVKAEIYEGE